MTSADGVEFVRTPDVCFENLPDWPYEAQYVEIDGLRQAYVDVGSGESGETILLLHGQPSWSYLYRKMIPVLEGAGHRVIAMDHLGMGRSDKPIDPDYYTYLGHVARLETFIQDLELEQGNLNIFVQDWGSLIGLYVIGIHPDWFDRVVVGNGFLPVFEEGMVPAELPDRPAVTRHLFHANVTNAPDQQEPLYDEDGNRVTPMNDYFGIWIDYARNDGRFTASQILELQTYFPLTDEEEAAYDAPFPSRIAMGGPRAFPGIVNQLPGITQLAWEGLYTFEKPFLTIWGNNDPGNLGLPETQQTLLDSIPGTEGWDHVRLPEASHFLQDDQGEEIARRINEFIAQSPIDTDGSTMALDTLDRAARWLMTAIEELDSLEEISDDERESVRNYLHHVRQRVLCAGFGEWYTTVAYHEDNRRRRVMPASPVG
jgi:haloalkane dehalogenase